MFCLACIGGKCLKIPPFLNCWSEVGLFVGYLHWRSQGLTVCIWFDLVYYFLIYFVSPLFSFVWPFTQTVHLYIFFTPLLLLASPFCLSSPPLPPFVIIHLCHRFFPLPITLHLPASPYSPVFHYPGQHWLIFYFFTLHFLFFNSNILTFLLSFAPHFPHFCML